MTFKIISIEKTLSNGRFVDDNPDTQVLDSSFTIKLGRKTYFHGRAFTVKSTRNNDLPYDILSTQKGHGKVMVLDAGADKNCAVVGGHLAGDGAKNGWEGIIVNGAIRDTLEINETDIQVRALALSPFMCDGDDPGQTAVTLHFGGVIIEDGDYIYADEDGVVISKTALV